ncbi:MAG TPA: 50S ribosomal protein L22 [bacterium]|nr:50S ribosomal protein L22 [bacterium]
MKAIATNIRISPKKLAVVASIVRGQSAKHALDLLRFMPKKGAKILYKVVASAVANASHNDMQSLETLSVRELVVTKGIVYKRGTPISRGRSHPILKRTTNIRVELSAS